MERVPIRLPIKLTIKINNIKNKPDGMHFSLFDTPQN